MRVVIPGGQIVDMGHKGSPPVIERHSVPTYGVLPPEASRRNPRVGFVERLLPNVEFNEKPGDVGTRSNRMYAATRSTPVRLRRAAMRTLKRFYNTAKIVVRNP
jgi:hypothetical protein